MNGRLASSDRGTNAGSGGPLDEASGARAEFDGAADNAALVNDASDPRGRKLATLPAESPVPMFLCAQCGTQLALQDEVISKAFSGRNGRAYLLHTSMNTVIGKPEDRRLLTGMHTIADLSCQGCDTVIGWTYLKAWEGSQKYKEGQFHRCELQMTGNRHRTDKELTIYFASLSGRFIIERAAVHKQNNWS